jgi:hypothetical protein
MFVALFEFVRSANDAMAPSPTLIKGYTETLTFGINLPSLLAVAVVMLGIMGVVYYCERRSSARAQRRRPDDAIPPVIDQFDPDFAHVHGNRIEPETLTDHLNQPPAMLVAMVAPTPSWGIPYPSAPPGQGPGVQYGFYQQGPNHH